MSDPIVTEVCDLLRQREAVGLKKYGTNLMRTDLSLADWLRHALEETLDKALYLKRALKDLEGKS